MVLSEIPSMVGVWIFSGTRTFLVANLATNFQDLVAKVENLVALAPVLGAISRPDIPFFLQKSALVLKLSFETSVNWFEFLLG